MINWETIDLYKESFLASNKIYHTPQNEYTKIRYIEAFCSPDSKKRYLEVNTSDSEYDNFLKALRQERELKDIIQPNSITIRYGYNKPFNFHISQETNELAKDKQERQLWKFLHIANKFTPIDDKIIKDISKTLNVNIPGTARIPNQQELRNRELTGKFTSHITFNNKQDRQRFS